MIQVNRIYLIFNRLVTKKFLVDTSDAEKELQTNYPGINWGKGRLLNGASRETVKQWIKK